MNISVVMCILTLLTADVQIPNARSQAFGVSYIEGVMQDSSL